MDNNFKMEESISVIIIENNNNTREAVMTLINASAGFFCEKSFSTCEEALKFIDDYLPDIVLMDIELGTGMSGIEGMKKLKDIYPNLIILMFTVFEDDDKIFESIKAGANGYILKKTSPKKILESIKDAYNGGSPITPSIAKKILDTFSENGGKAKSFDLTPAEKRILKHLAEGSSYNSIADDLEISVHTVRSHIRNIYSKLYVHSKTEAVVKALKHKLI